MNKRLIIVLIILIVMAFGVVLIKNNSKETPHESPQDRRISKNIFFLGKFKPKEVIKLQPVISGIIDSIYVKINDKVRIGDDIAQLRIIPIPEELERTKRSLRIASKDLKQKEIDYNRSETLFKKGVIAKSELEKSKLSLEFAQIEYSAAENNLNIAQRGYSNNKKESPNIVKSTIDGIVIDVLVKKGMSVTERNTFNEGSTIATIANRNNFIFEFEAGEIDINNLSLGVDFDVSIKALAGKKVKAKVIELKPKADGDKNFSYLVTAEILKDTISKIRSGYSGLAEFTLAQKEKVLSIKENNIFYKGRKAFVLILDKNDTYLEIEIETGLSDGIYTEVLNGLDSDVKIKIQ